MTRNEDRLQEWLDRPAPEPPPEPPPTLLSALARLLALPVIATLLLWRAVPYDPWSAVGCGAIVLFALLLLMGMRVVRLVAGRKS